MGKLLKKILRLGAFTSLVLIVFLTNIVSKLGFSGDPKDENKNPNDLFASFSSVPTAHADISTGPGDSGPNCDAGPCDGPCPH
jgi:hypothetical protein